jgi:hypothetical protein
MEQDLGKLQRLAEVQDKAKKNKNFIMGILAVYIVMKLLFLPMGWIDKIITAFITAIVVILAAPSIISKNK